METNLVEKWLTRDPVRWIAGVISGVFAGGVALLVAMIFAKGMGYEIWFPAKYMALPILGADALAYGMSVKAIGVGLFVLGILCGFWGFVFAHFTFTNSVPSLFGMGLTWGTFSWIFLNNLYSPSFREIFVVQFSSGAALIICLAYGLALISVAFFDRLLRG